jgi:hypothetical protein
VHPLNCAVLICSSTAAKDAYTECRQVAAAAGLPILLDPAGVAVSPAVTLKQCSRMEYIVGHQQDASGGRWIQIRYYSGAFLQYGWVQASNSACGQAGAALEHDCPSSEPACAQVSYCRQVRL